MNAVQPPSWRSLALIHRTFGPSFTDGLRLTCTSQTVGNHPSNGITGTSGPSYLAVSISCQQILRGSCRDDLLQKKKRTPPKDSRFSKVANRCVRPAAGAWSGPLFCFYHVKSTARARGVAAPVDPVGHPTWHQFHKQSQVVFARAVTRLSLSLIHI